MIKTKSELKWTTVFGGADGPPTGRRTGWGENFRFQFAIE
jgi:hypothetical protein